MSAHRRGRVLQSAKLVQELSGVVHKARDQARAKRAALFRSCFAIAPQTRILDVGSENGAMIAAVLKGTRVAPKNVYIADVDHGRVMEGAKRYGFVPVPITESGKLPFEDNFFDIVYCSSVIEHVTVPKSDVWTSVSGREFRAIARRRQREFAAEIRRLGKSYYVQTPNKWFPIESHTWLPLVGFLPRRLQVSFIRVSNRCWIKATSPDWNLLTAQDMGEMFPDSEIRYERFMGLKKSIMAIKN